MGMNYHMLDVGGFFESICYMFDKQVTYDLLGINSMDFLFPVEFFSSNTKTAGFQTNNSYPLFLLSAVFLP